MKHTGIHILDFNDKIIDYISRDDGALLNAVMSTNAEEKSETFDFTMLNDRAEHLRERNRIIAQDNNGVYREFIISHVVDNFDGTTDVESNASYLEDIDKSRPIKPGKYSSYSTSQALNETLRNTGWEMSDDTEHGGMRTTSWTSYSTPYEVINMLCTTYGMVAEYYIELGSHTVEHRYVTLKKPVSLFKGKEITKGKDLTGMTRTVDMSEVRTALYAIGPENDTGQRLEKIVTDDDAQAQFGLPGRYLWSVYEPESDDSNMTDERLTTLAKTELNKRNKSAISYEITSTDIHRHYPEMVVSLHDTVRIKDRDFRPPLYIEAEVIGVDYNLLTDESNYKFGNVVEYEENNLRDIFNKKLADISKKLNDNVSNVNTIVKDAVAGQLEYFERKIFKGATEPENPVNDMFWYDTSNPNVAVLRRYWNGEWLNETVDDVEKIGGITREKALLSELQNTFANLSIQHSKILNDTNEVLNSEYLVDTDLKNKLQTEINNIDEIYLSIQSDLNAMTPDTATIGALIDIQSQFSSYRQKLQDLYKTMRDSKVSADKRLQLLQSQYTDEKFNDALNKVATKFGLTIDENNNMVGTPDVIEKAIQSSREDTEEQLKSYVKSIDYETDQNGIVQRLDSADSERLQLSNQISDKVSLSEYKNGIDSVKSTNRNYLQSYYSPTQNIVNGVTNSAYNVTLNTSRTLNFYFYDRGNGANPTLEQNTDYILKIHESDLYVKVGVFYNKGSNTIVGYTTDKVVRFNTKAYQDIRIVLMPSADNQFIGKVSLYKGTKELDWSPAPEDIERLGLTAENNAKAYTDKYKQDTDTKLTNMTTSITQNGQDIQQRATKEEFNASKKTLSKTISDFTNNVATGMTFTYDRDGAIQNMNIGQDGIKLKGDKVDITVNKDFNVMAGKVDDKVGKDEVVNRLNLSNEGLDIDVNRLGIKGGNNASYVDIRNEKIELGGKFSRTWKGSTSRNEIFTRLKDGHLRFRNNKLDRSLYVSEFGISTYIDGEGEGQGSSGTIAWWDTTFSPSNANGITINSYGGVVALTSDLNRIVINSYASSNIESRTAPVYISPHQETRPGLNRFSFTLANADSSSNTDGYIMFGSDENYSYGAGLRFSKSKNGKTVQVVDGDYSTGGDTTIEAGYGQFNTISRRSGNDYVRIVSDSAFLVGKDRSGGRVASDYVYNRTYSSSPNMFVTSEGTLGRSTSASKYKLLIKDQYTEEDQLKHSNNILKLNPKSWFDKAEVENYAKELELGRKLSPDNYSLKRHVGLIAEDLVSSGLSEHVSYNSSGEVEGIEYDRLWIHLIPIIKNLNEKVEKLEEQINER